MPRITNPGDIATGPGKAVSTDTDELVLKSYAGGAGAGAYIPPGETTPRSGYPALPCRACGGGAGGGGGTGTAGSVEDTVLTVGDPTLHPGWSGVTPDYATLGEAVAAAGALMDPAGGLAGRNVRIWVIGPTLEPQANLPIVIPTDGLIIEGAPWTNDGGPPPAVEIAWDSPGYLFNIDGHNDLIFRNLSFNNVYAGIVTDTSPYRRAIFVNLTTPSSNVIVENCRSKGNIVQGFILTETDLVNWTVVDNLADTRIYGVSTTGGGTLFTPAVFGRLDHCNISHNQFTYQGTSSPFDGVYAYDDTFGESSDINVVEENTFTGYRHGVNVFGNANVIDNNFVQESIEEGIITLGVLNRVLKNGLLECYQDPSPKTGITIAGNSNVCRENIVSLFGDVSTDAAIQVTGGANNIVSDNDTVQSSGGINLVAGGTTAGGNQCRRLNVGADDCVVQGNEIDGDAIWTPDADNCVIGNNKITGDLVIVETSLRHTIEGNSVEGNMMVNSAYHTILGNIVRGALGLILNIPATDCTISGNRVSNFLQVAGFGCTISGNIVMKAIDVQGINCTITGNKCDILLNSNGGAPPAGVTIVGNRYMDSGAILPAGSPEFLNIPNNSTPDSVGNV